MTPPVLRVLSLGAGVQSSTVLLMSLAGELPRLDAAIFADTGWEPRAVFSFGFNNGEAIEGRLVQYLPNRATPTE